MELSVGEKNNTEVMPGEAPGPGKVAEFLGEVRGVTGERTEVLFYLGEISLGQAIRASHLPEGRKTICTGVGVCCRRR